MAIHHLTWSIGLTFSVRLRTNSGVACLEAAASPDLVQTRTVLSAVLLRDLDHPAASLSATSASVIARTPRTPFAHRAIHHCKGWMSLALRSGHLIVYRGRKIKLSRNCHCDRQINSRTSGKYRLIHTLSLASILK